MTESNDNWFGSWLNSAKSRSSQVLEFVKKDLGEFGSAVKNEATNVVSTTGSVIGKTLKLDEPDSTASSMKRSLSAFLGQMNEVLNPSPDDSETEAIMIVEDAETVTLTKFQLSLYNLQKNPDTYSKDPEPNLTKQYECWLDILGDQLSKERIAKHLTSSTVLQSQYSSLVPETVSHTTFWKRYLFKKALLEDDMARQEALERKEKKEKKTEENLEWETEDFGNDIELTEEEQIRLLEEYEKETKTKQKQRSPKRSLEEIKSTTSKFQENSEEIVVVKKEIIEGSTKILDEVEKLDEKIDELSCCDPLNKVVASSSSSSSTDEDWEKINEIEK